MEFKAVYSTFLYVESFELSTTKIRLDLRWERKHYVSSASVKAPN